MCGDSKASIYFALLSNFSQICQASRVFQFLYELHHGLLMASRNVMGVGGMPCATTMLVPLKRY